MKHLRDLAMATLAGVAISISCIVFLTIENPIIGSLLFSVGLLTVLKLKLNLFTGKAPYICNNKPSYILFTLLVWLGNFAGTGLTAFLISFTRIKDKIIERCISVAQMKINDNLLSLFILAIFCGIMMYIAVDTYINQSKDKNFTSGLIVVLCVSVFILAGFEHSVADMFYFIFALPFKQWIIPLLVITAGNIVGGNLFCYITKELKLKENKDVQEAKTTKSNIIK